MHKQINHKKLYFLIIAFTLAMILLLSWVGLAYFSLNKIVTEDRKIAKQTQFIAHRGYSALYMENTKEAFSAASSASFFQGIETDIWQTKDGIFVCSHNVNPFVDKSIYITNSNFDEIKNLPLDISAIKYDIDKSIEYRICTLGDYLSLCLVSSKFALIEVKQVFDSEKIEQLLTFVKGKISYENVFFGSFDKNNIELIYKKAPYFKVLLFSNSPFYSHLYAFLGYSIGVSQNTLTSKMIDQTHKNNSYTFVYTLVNNEQLTKFSNLKVDFVICDSIIA